MPIINIDCQACRGTGLYCGYAEPKGVAVVCAGCGGSGCARFNYEPFTQRKPKFGVKSVRLSAGSFLVTGVGPTGSEITYAEFAAGKLPQERAPQATVVPLTRKKSTAKR
jgi:hypothetical protein